jgi:hypothetical protein
MRGDKLIVHIACPPMYSDGSEPCAKTDDVAWWSARLASARKQDPQLRRGPAWPQSRRRSLQRRRSWAPMLSAVSVTAAAQAGVQRRGPPLQQTGNRESSPDARSRNQVSLIEAGGPSQNHAREAEEAQCAAAARACNGGPQQSRFVHGRPPLRCGLQMGEPATTPLPLRAGISAAGRGLRRPPDRCAARSSRCD